MVITEQPLITDPEERKKLRDRLCAEYKRLTGVAVAQLIEKKIRRNSIKDYSGLGKKHLLDISCEYLKLKKEDVLGPSRKVELVKCRQMIGYLLTEMGITREDVYPILGYKDHSTVVHGVTAVKGYLKVDKEYRQEYKQYKEYCLGEMDKRKKVNPPPLDPEQIAAIQYSIKKGGITRKELAEIYGVAPGTISKYTKEKRVFKNGRK